MPNVFEEITPDEREDIKSKQASGLRFSEYLGKLLKMLEEKLNLFAQEHVDNLSMRDLVFYGQG
eukprot:CAMPEP_0185576002 /NCGR_PEP_ID=MMETSP0434-20130131/7038_1 /TAXON_ID=626734 ORGANISM="Favella taraikaensis, Strain Fe Narragansett Bay" /NCGR_SAMPLE_ID=MMETSP0434 /ASSEMBLY_ACC=CAM_ASM_000379 /LENGTH=63 /DNA_ID=CAMNT_0028193049 /DNA_START=115 /DNA_END=306 /DNA_ORIENTATION=+